MLCHYFGLSPRHEQNNAICVCYLFMWYIFFLQFTEVCNFFLIHACINLVTGPEIFRSLGSVLKWGLSCFLCKSTVQLGYKVAFSAVVWSWISLRTGCQFESRCHQSILTFCTTPRLIHEGTRVWNRNLADKRRNASHHTHLVMMLDVHYIY